MRTRHLLAPLILACAALGSVSLAGDDLDPKIDAFFAKLDLDRDGRVGPRELTDAALFARLDRDGDGAVTRADFRHPLPPAIRDEPDVAEQGSKDGASDHPTPPTALKFALMMAVTAEDWERLAPFARPGDLYWGDVSGIPAKVRAIAIAPGADVAALPDPADLLGCAAVFADLRAGTAAEAAARTRAIKAWLDSANARNTRRSAYVARPLVARHTSAHLADEPDLARLADVVLIGDASWSAATLEGTTDEKPNPRIGAIELAGRAPGIWLGSTAEHPRDAPEVEALVRAVLAKKLTHVGFEAAGDRLRALTDALARLR